MIMQVRGVNSARVVFEGDNITEIHVLADATRSPKQVVRDVESAVAVKFGIALDHRLISVVQLGEDEPLINPVQRMQLKGISYAVKDRSLEVNATIAIDSSNYTAAAAALNIKKNRLKLVAEATLAAIETYLGKGPKFVVNDVQKIIFGGQEVILFSASLNQHSYEETLLGTALVKGDELESVARATLDAVNRRLFLIKEC
jgi:hypothetical protein